MQITNILNEAQGGGAIDNLAAAFGVSPAQARAAVDAMTAALSQRVERNTLSRGGLADTVALLEQPGAGRALTDPQSLTTPQTAAAGDHVLDVLIGNKDTSRAIAQRANRASGLDEETLKKMLPVVASMMIGALQSKTNATFAERFGGVPGLGISAGGSPLPLPGDDFPDVRQQAGPPNSTGRGELPRPSRGGGTTGGGPLPIPGDDIPGLDPPGRFPNLPDIVRRGGTQIPGPDGGSLDDIIRSILGGLLGFRNGGVISWILKIIFARWFMGLVRRILSRVVLGR